MAHATPHWKEISTLWCVSPTLWWVSPRTTALFYSMPAFPDFLNLGLSIHLLQQKRKSHMDLGEIYFWTATINHWFTLLQEDRYKDIIIQSLNYLTNHHKIDVFAFVIMPTHIHFIWRMLALNGKESAQGSFLKYTAHEFQKLLRCDDQRNLSLYKVNASNKEHEFWQRDPLAIHLYTWKVAFQKLKYIHRNPLAGKWQLVKDPCEYVYSSAAFYELGEKRFEFLKDLREEF